MPFEIDGLLVRTVAEEPALEAQMEDLVVRVWPAYVVESRSAFADMPVRWSDVYRRWPLLQFALSEPGAETILAGGNSLALAWDGALEDLPARGWTWAMYNGAADDDAGHAPLTQCALSITVAPEAQGRGLSALMVRAMKRLGQEAGLRRLVAPVRPSLKARYPLSTLEEYVTWRTPDGHAFDPWMRTHERVGGRFLHVCAQSMGMAGSVADWERWSGLRFPVPGQYAVEGCLAPVDIDLAADRGLYIEPNAWMVHEFGGTS